MPPKFEPIDKNNSYIDLMLTVAKEEKLVPIKSKSGKNFLVCKNINGDLFFLKICNDKEKNILTRILPSIEQRNLIFNTLEFPKCLKVISKVIYNNNNLESLNLILFPYFDGKRFNNDWDEISLRGNGGKGMKLEFAEKVIDLVKDLSLIDVAPLNSFNLPTFNFTNWKNQNFPYISEILIERKIITMEQAIVASTIFESFKPFKNSELIFTNGDFYPRNLIQRPDGRVVIVDWEGRQDYEEPNLNDQRNVLVNYPENLISFFFIHMWGNLEFQKRLLSIATKKLLLVAKDLQFSIIMKSLEQALIWPDDLATYQAQLFANALNISYVEELSS